ncbi:MAG: DUF2269 domain-containing protein [Rudaea sp.]
MNAYAAIKFVHVLSSTILFGTGLGTAFHLWMTHRTRDVRAIASAARLSVLADTWFTTPAVIVQPLSGFALMHVAGFGWSQSWLVVALLLYLVAGACWLPVVWLQLRVRDLASRAAASGMPLPPAYFRAMRIWFALGWPAFGAVIAVFWLMVAKPALW